MNKFIILILFIALIYLAYSYRHDIMRGGFETFYKKLYNDDNDQWLRDNYHVQLMAVRGDLLKEALKKSMENITEDEWKQKYVGESISAGEDTLHLDLLMDGKRIKINIIEHNSRTSSIQFAYLYHWKGFQKLDDSIYFIPVFIVNTEIHRIKTWELDPELGKEKKKEFMKFYNDPYLITTNIKKYSPGLFVNSGENKNSIDDDRRIGMNVKEIPDWWKTVWKDSSYYTAYLDTTRLVVSSDMKNDTYTHLEDGAIVFDVVDQSGTLFRDHNILSACNHYRKYGNTKTVEYFIDKHDYTSRFIITTQDRGSTMIITPVGWMPMVFMQRKTGYDAFDEFQFYSAEKVN